MRPSELLRDLYCLQDRAISLHRKLFDMLDDDGRSEPLLKELQAGKTLDNLWAFVEKLNTVVTRVERDASTKENQS